ncbi:MAG TPA: biotin/lipoyl-containing protein, partial [Haliangium sp.]|nr:biotin/lipoyl-containing protein [Haliangium sp.]
MAVESVEVRVPSVGESITEVTIGKWLKQQGDSVAKDEPLVELETDKATVEVAAPVAGTLVEVLKKQGQSASVDDVIAHIRAGAGAGEVSQAALKEPPSAARGGEEARGKDAGEAPRVMPAAQRMLDEHGLDARAVEATGPGGRLLKEDVQRHVGGAAGAAGAIGAIGAT